jgi:hypothetical protein
VLIGTTSIRLSKDHHDPWGTCTTSTECKIVITDVLTVMSGMDPHMITGTWDGLLVKSLVGCVKVGLVGCGSVKVRLRGTIEIIIFEEMSCYLITRILKA